METKTCINCKHMTCHNNFGSSVDINCELETQIPFFDMADRIGNPYEDSCEKWEKRDGK